MASPLKNERVRLGLSTTELALAVGVQQPTINRIENGKKRPSPELAIRISEFLNGTVTRDQIIFPELYPTTKKPSGSVQEAG